jgi:hypothetical protein
MKRSTYSETTKSHFEIISCYFADTFWNHLYSQSNILLNNKATGESSLTDEYKKAISAYKAGLADNRYLEMAIKGILQYYRVHTAFSSITLNDLMDRILSQFIPEEKYSSMAPADKDFFIGDIIRKVVNKFVVKLIQDPAYLKMVIDDHSNGSNVKQWISALNDIQGEIRETIYAQFVRQQVGGKSKESSEYYIDIEVVKKLETERDKIWKQLSAIVKEKLHLQEQLSRATKISETLYSSNTALIDQNKKYEEKIAKLETQNEQLMDKITSLAVNVQRPVVEKQPFPTDNNFTQSPRRATSGYSNFTDHTSSTPVVSTKHANHANNANNTNHTNYMPNTEYLANTNDFALDMPDEKDEDLDVIEEVNRVDIAPRASNKIKRPIDDKNDDLVNFDSDMSFIPVSNKISNKKN